MNIGMTIECTCIHMLWTGHVQKLQFFFRPNTPVGQTSSSSISSLDHSQEMMHNHCAGSNHESCCQNLYTHFVNWNNGDNGGVQGQTNLSLCWPNLH